MTRTLLVCVTLLVLTLPSRAENWPAWRGPNADGTTAEKDLPLKWSPTENVKWKLPLPGPGNSTPIVWGDKIFLTQTTDKGHKRILMCLDRKNGQRVWEKVVEYPDDDPTHGTNPHGSASPVTDGERVIVSHGSAGVYCYDFTGKELWKRDFGKCYHMWGYASSPVLYGDLVIQSIGPCDHNMLVAMNKKTGEDVWKVEETSKGEKDYFGSWSTPVVARIDGQDQLIMSWPSVVKAHDLKTGKVIWSCTGLEKDRGADRLVYTSPILGQDLIIAMAGFGGAAIGLKPGGQGDVTAKQRLWRHPSSPQRIGSGVILGEHAYILNEPGEVQCLNGKTGKALWTQEIGGMWGSLIHSDGRFYVTTNNGATVVFEANPDKFVELARNPLNGEMTRASIAVSDGDLFIRTHKNLWCIGKPAQ